MKQGLPKSEEDWIKLVQRQEMLHQLELEKWHDLLGTATHLLRQVSFFTIFLNFDNFVTYKLIAIGANGLLDTVD